MHPVMCMHSELWVLTVHFGSAVLMFTVAADEHSGGLYDVLELDMQQQQR